MALGINLDPGEAQLFCSTGNGKEYQGMLVNGAIGSHIWSRTTEWVIDAIF